MGAQSWGQRLLTPGPLLARFVPNCANWSVGSAHWAQPTAQAQIVWDKLLRTVQVRPLRLRPKDQPTIVGAAHCTAGASHPAPGPPSRLGLPSSPRPHFAHPTWRSQLPSAQLPQIVWDKPLRAMLCSLCSSPPILQTPKTISLFLTLALCTVAPTREVATV